MKKDQERYEQYVRSSDNEIKNLKKKLKSIEQYKNTEITGYKFQIQQNEYLINKLNFEKLSIMDSLNVIRGDLMKKIDSLEQEKQCLKEAMLLSQNDLACLYSIIQETKNLKKNRIKSINESCISNRLLAISKIENRRKHAHIVKSSILRLFLRRRFNDVYNALKLREKEYSTNFRLINECNWLLNEELVTKNHEITYLNNAIHKLKVTSSENLSEIDTLSTRAKNLETDLQSLHEELRLANLCIAERRQQRERELNEYLKRESHLLNANESLRNELDNLFKHRKKKTDIKLNKHLETQKTRPISSSPFYDAVLKGKSTVDVMSSLKNRNLSKIDDNG